MSNRVSKKLGLSGGSSDIWTLASDETGEAAEMSAGGDVEFQVVGQFNGASVGIEGTNNPDANENDWSAVSDAMGFPLEFNDGTPIKSAGAVPYAVRPVVRGGDDQTAVRVLMLVRKSTR